MNDGAGLPAALAPIAEVLALAESFALCIVTGPRDHRDSVFLRLHAAFAAHFEVVRHRLEQDGLEFFDLLTGGDGIHPRLVFMSGLERLSDAARRDAIVRLNLLRDSWAPHPARVIVWLPAWGLGEFRKLAPDLFHWRSCLVPLHDADLPIRTEVEYLVWACERYAGVSRVWPMNATEVRALLAHPRSVHGGYDVQERSQLLLAATRYFAALRLLALVAPGLDLDIMSQEQAPAVEGPAILPLLLRAADLAGRLPLEPDWPSIARAAGIPLADTGADFLARVSQHGALLILIDAIDVLDLSPGAPAQRLLTWLDTENPAAHIATFAVDDSLPILRNWTHRPHAGSSYLDANDRLPPGMAPRTAFVGLLLRLFATSRDLHMLAHHLFGPELAAAVSSERAVHETAEDFTRELERRGLLDASFVDELKRVRPMHTAEIDAIARAYFGLARTCA